MEKILMPVPRLQSAVGSGPTYNEMLHPETLPATIRQKAFAARDNELDPINLYNITWRGPDNTIRHIVLPKELTGVEANIIVLVGREFPSGSHKVGPAYATLMEGSAFGSMAASST
jgi:cysteine synthase A